MSELEVKSVASLAGSGVSYAYAVKAGPWIFLTGHEAFDFATGAIDAVAGPPGHPQFGRPRYRREGDFILQRMRRILQEFGSDLPHGFGSTSITRRRRRSIPIIWASRRARRLHPAEHIGIMQRCSIGRCRFDSMMAVVPSAGYQIERIYLAT
jgi:hypothetical protein